MTLPIRDLYTESQLPVVLNISLPPGLLGHPRSCTFPQSYTPESQLPVILNISLPPGIILDLKPEPQLPVVLNVSLPPGLFHGLRQMSQALSSCYPQHWAPKTHTLTSESGPNVTPTMVQSRLLFLGACQQDKARTASPDGSPHQSDHRWVCHPVDIILDWYEKL